MEGTLENRDSLNLMDSKEMKRIIKKGEKLIWSGNLTKINKLKKRQVRRFVLTNEQFCNIGDTKFKDKFISMFTGSKAKRTVALVCIECITYSETSNEWVLHIPKEYDYRLSSASIRNEFIYYLLRLRESKTPVKMKFFFKEDLELSAYCKNEHEQFRPKRMSKMPTTEPVEMSADDFQAWVDKKTQQKKEVIEQTETLISRIENVTVTEDDFEPIKV